MQEGLLAKIPNKADKWIVAVYTEYASDHNGRVHVCVRGASEFGRGCAGGDGCKEEFLQDGTRCSRRRRGRRRRWCRRRGWGLILCRSRRSGGDGCMARILRSMMSGRRIRRAWSWMYTWESSSARIFRIIHSTVHPQHPPDEEYRNDRSCDVNDPVANGFRFSEIEHAAMVADAAAEIDASQKGGAVPARAPPPNSERAATGRSRSSPHAYPTDSMRATG